MIKENINRPGVHVVDEVGGSNYRDKHTITGGDYQAGTVMGQITASKKLTQLDPGASDGSENAHSVLFRKALAASGDVESTVNEILTVFDENMLIFPDGISEANKAAAIAQLTAKNNRFQ